MKILRFNELNEHWSEEYDEKYELEKLYDDDGKLLDIEGYAIIGAGIFDLSGEEYPAGLDSKGELYASYVDDNNQVLNNMDEKIPGLFLDDDEKSMISITKESNIKNFENFCNESKEKDSKLKNAGVEGYNKPKRTPDHPTKSHIVVAKEGDKTKTIRFGEQGAKTAGKPKEGESDKMKQKRKSFKARHAKNIAKGKMSAAYWADKTKW